MANLKSSKKDIRRIAKRTVLNKPFRRNAKMLSKKVTKLVSLNNLEEAKNTLPAAFKALDKAAKKNIIHRNAAARTKSRLSKLIFKSEQAV